MRLNIISSLIPSQSKSREKKSAALSLVENTDRRRKFFLEGMKSNRKMAFNKAKKILKIRTKSQL